MALQAEGMGHGAQTLTRETCTSSTLPYKYQGEACAAVSAMHGAAGGRGRTSSFQQENG